jgi:hypothetical protein
VSVLTFNGLHVATTTREAKMTQTLTTGAMIPTTHPGPVDALEIHRTHLVDVVDGTPQDVTINRVRQYPTPGSNPRAAWKWLYSVVAPDGTETTIGNRLDSTLDWARRRHPGSRIVLAWNPRPVGGGA